MKKVSDFKVGDKVISITEGLNIECEIISILDNSYSSDFLVKDISTGFTVYVRLDEIDFDKAYYRNKAIESLGI